MTSVRVVFPSTVTAAFQGRVTKATEAALRAIAEDALEKSNRIIPLGEGILQDSGFVEVDQDTTPGTLVAQVAYSTPYAVKQHEDQTLRHDPGRTDHFLEKTVNEQAAAWERYLADRLKGG